MIPPLICVKNAKETVSNTGLKMVNYEHLNSSYSHHLSLYIQVITMKIVKAIWYVRRDQGMKRSRAVRVQVPQLICTLRIYVSVLVSRKILLTM